MVSDECICFCCNKTEPREMNFRLLTAAGGLSERVTETLPFVHSFCHLPSAVCRLSSSVACVSLTFGLLAKLLLQFVTRLDDFVHLSPVSGCCLHSSIMRRRCAVALWRPALLNRLTTTRLSHCPSRSLANLACRRLLAIPPLSRAIDTCRHCSPQPPRRGLATFPTSTAPARPQSAREEEVMAALQKVKHPGQQPFNMECTVVP